MCFEELISELEKIISVLFYYADKDVKFKVIPIYQRTVYKIASIPKARYEGEKYLFHLSESLFKFLNNEVPFKFTTEIECVDIYREVYYSQVFSAIGLTEISKSCMKKLEYDILISELL